MAQIISVRHKFFLIVKYLVKKSLDSEYVIIGPRAWEAKIFLAPDLGEEIAEVKKGEDQKSFKLIRKKDGHVWILSKKVHGEFRPFSISVIDQNANNTNKNKREDLTIREHLFKYRGKFYMLTNHPEGKHWNDYLSGPRYISRLDNFPHSDLEEIDHHIKHKLRRFRGVPVGEVSGLGLDGHHVKVDKELEDIGLLVAASSYLIYATA
jgi:hypothetical protein